MSTFAEAFDKLNSHEERLKHSDPILVGNAQPAAPAQTAAGAATAGTARDAVTGDVQPEGSSPAPEPGLGGFVWTPETHTQPTANNICIAVAEYYGVSTKTAWRWCVDAFAKCERVAA